MGLSVEETLEWSKSRKVLRCFFVGGAGGPVLMEGSGPGVSVRSEDCADTVQYASVDSRRKHYDLSTSVSLDGLVD